MKRVTFCTLKETFKEVGNDELLLLTTVLLLFN
jgi:hypothetical protein